MITTVLTRYSSTIPVHDCAVPNLLQFIRRNPYEIQLHLNHGRRLLLGFPLLQESLVLILLRSKLTGQMRTDNIPPDT